MLIELVVLTLIDPLLVIVCSLVRVSSLGLPNAGLLFLDRVLKLNIGLLLTLWLKFHGFIPCCLSLAINYHLRLWFFVTMLVLFFLHLIQFRTCAQNMLKLTFTLCMKTWLLGLFVFFMFPHSFNLQISWPRVYQVSYSLNFTPIWMFNPFLFRLRGVLVSIFGLFDYVSIFGFFNFGLYICYVYLWSIVHLV